MLTAASPSVTSFLGSLHPTRVDKRRIIKGSLFVNSVPSAVASLGDDLRSERASRWNTYCLYWSLEIDDNSKVEGHLETASQNFVPYGIRIWVTS